MHNLILIILFILILFILILFILILFILILFILILFILILFILIVFFIIVVVAIIIRAILTSFLLHTKKIRLGDWRVLVGSEKNPEEVRSQEGIEGNLEVHSHQQYSATQADHI
jgi:hypothetical protein